MLLVAAVSTSARAEKQKTIVYVDAGKPSHMKVLGKPWTVKEGRIECVGSGDRKDRLVMGHSIGPGDFHIKARLTVTDLDRSAASFRFGMDNSAIFGFEGAHDAMYVAGKFFKANPHSGKIGDPSEFIQDGEPFDWEFIREGDQLRILIDGKLVRKQTVSPGMLMRLSDGRLVLFWNAIPNEGFVRREELSVAFSSDDGKTWTKPRVIAKNPTGRVSYPYVFEAEPGVLWVTTMQGNFRGSMKVDELYNAATSQASAPEFHKSTKYVSGNIRRCL